MNERRFACVLLGCTVVLAACNKPEIQSYKVPKETPPSAAPAMASSGGGGAMPAPAGAASARGSMASTPVATASGPGLTWTAPKHWNELPATQMRRGNFTVKAEGVAGEAELTITTFPGDVGGELANINRWRGQVELPSITQAQVEASTQHLDRNGLHLTVVELAGGGANAKRLLGAIVPHGEGTWFVKLIGPDAIVAKEKNAFMAFLDTLKPAAP